jgi:hypothetical protein
MLRPVSDRDDGIDLAACPAQDRIILVRAPATFWQVGHGIITVRAPSSHPIRQSWMRWPRAGTRAANARARASPQQDWCASRDRWGALDEVVVRRFEVRHRALTIVPRAAGEPREKRTNFASRDAARFAAELRKNVAHAGSTRVGLCVFLNEAETLREPPEQPGNDSGPSSKRLLGQLPGRGWVRLPCTSAPI